MLWAKLTDTRSLQDQWGTQSTAADDDELAALVVLVPILAWRQWLGWASPDPDATIAFEECLLDFSVAHQVQILVVLPGAVDVCVSGVTATAGVSIDPLQPVLSSVAGDEILQVVRDRDVLGFDGTQEVLHDGVGVVAEGDLTAESAWNTFLYPSTMVIP